MNISRDTRYAGENDVPAIVDIWNSFLIPDESGYLHQPANRNAVLQKINSFMVFSKGDQVLGFVQCDRLPELPKRLAKIHIKNVAVHKEHQGHGIALSLYNGVASHCTEMTATLAKTPVENTASIEFHKSLGFVKYLSGGGSQGEQRYSYSGVRGKSGFVRRKHRESQIAATHTLSGKGSQNKGCYNNIQTTVIGL